MDSFWRHPFTAEDPLMCKWCSAKFLQICSDDFQKFWIARCKHLGVYYSFNLFSNTAVTIYFIRWFLWIQTQKQICICVLALISASICMCVFVDGLTATSTLSAQSAPSVYPSQQGFLAPGGMIDGGSSPLLQSFKPSPSNENLCSAYTSDATLSAASLCLTSQGKNKET